MEKIKVQSFFFFQYWINDHLHCPVLWWHTMTASQESICDRIWVLHVSHPRVRCWCHTLWDTHHPPGLMSQWLMNEMHPFMWTTWRVYEPSHLSSSVHSFFICVQLCVCVFVLQKGYNLTSTVFFHTQIDKKAILRYWKKGMRTKLQKNELWLK